MSELEDAKAELAELGTRLSLAAVKMREAHEQHGHVLRTHRRIEREVWRLENEVDLFETTADAVQLHDVLDGQLVVRITTDNKQLMKGPRTEITFWTHRGDTQIMTAFSAEQLVKVVRRSTRIEDNRASRVEKVIATDLVPGMVINGGGRVRFTFVVTRVEQAPNEEIVLVYGPNPDPTVVLGNKESVVVDKLRAPEFRNQESERP